MNSYRLKFFNGVSPFLKQAFPGLTQFFTMRREVRNYDIVCNGQLLFCIVLQARTIMRGVGEDAKTRTCGLPVGQ